MNISGNTILITGGTSGIGLAFAEEFLKQGNKVIITGRREDRLNEIKGRLPEIVIKVSDVADAIQRIELARWINQDHPETNILINNAGIQLITDFSEEIDLSRIQSEIETNFIAPVHLSSLFISQLTGKKMQPLLTLLPVLLLYPLLPWLYIVLQKQLCIL